MKPSDVTVVCGLFELEPDDVATIADEFKNATYTIGRRLDNSAWHSLGGIPRHYTFSELDKDLTRLAAHADSRLPTPPDPLRDSAVQHRAREQVLTAVGFELAGVAAAFPRRVTKIHPFRPFPSGRGAIKPSRSSQTHDSINASRIAPCRSRGYATNSRWSMNCPQRTCELFGLQRQQGVCIGQHLRNRRHQPPLGGKA